MDASTAVLLVDDGELDAVATLLASLDVGFERLRGGEIGEDMEPPRELLVTTPRRARCVRRRAPAGARPGRPVRMAWCDEDSPALRYMLRELGFQLLVRSHTPPGVLRLLVMRALFQGDEQRAAPRVPAVREIDVHGDAALPAHAVLMDLSNRGCRFLSSRGVASGSRVRLEVPTDELDGQPLCLTGRVVRSTAEDREAFTAAVLFDEVQDETEQRRLARLLNSLSRGVGSLSAEEDPSSMDFLPARTSTAMPGLRLDAETDPPVAADLPVSVRVDEDGSERRQHARAPFRQKVVARGEEGRRVLMGRDLSRDGMRVERLDEVDLGDRLRLSVFAPGRAEPFVVDAVVARDDAERGLVLRFQDLPAHVGDALERLVAGLPDLEALEEGEAANLGRVISEILPPDDDSGAPTDRLR